MESTTTKKPFKSVVIIGAGLSGIGMGCKLKSSLKMDDFVIYERESDIGGTWYANQYPGCAVDVPSIFYSFSFAPNPDFTKAFPERQEIFNYIHNVVKKFDLVSHIQCCISWEKAEWNDESKTWMTHHRDLRTGIGFSQECKILMSAVGGLVTPNEWVVKGIETFKGKLMHSARYVAGTDLKNKNVILIGNGCSATQIVPAIVGDVETLTQFIRTPQYFFERPDPSIPPWMRALFRYVPGLLWSIRAIVFVLIESNFRQFYLDAKGQRLRDSARAKSIDYVHKTAPEEYWPLLVPSFKIGCKRRIFDPGYLKVLHRKNIYLTNDPVIKVKNDSVITKSGASYPADVIIVANGFQTGFKGETIPVIGRDGATLSSHWGKFGGPEAYKTCALADFPNFFIIFGPNSAPGHTSVIYLVESAIGLILRVIKPVLAEKAQQIEVDFAAEKIWVDELQGALKQRVWADNCGSFYVDKRTGWNFSTYPYSCYWLWFTNRFPDMKAWVFK